MDRLHPVERACGVAQLADAVVEAALAAADAAEVEAQRGEAAVGERLVQALDDAVVHCPAALRMRVKDHRHRRTRTRGWRETTFEAAFGAGKDDGGHCVARMISETGRQVARPKCRAI